jgi:hypothetical protein
MQYVKLQTNGVWVTCPEASAQGIVFDGVTIVPERDENGNFLLLEAVRKAKTDSLSTACHAAIVAGFDHENAHYSLNYDDQSNILGLTVAIIGGAETVSYHADNEPCRDFTAAEFVALSQAATEYKTAQLTKFNELKQSILAAETIAELEGLKW